MDGNPSLKDVGVLHAVGVGHAAPDQIAHGVLLLTLQTGDQLTGGAVDDFHIDVGIDLSEAVQQGVDVVLGHGAVEYQITGEGGGLTAGGGTRAAGSGGVFLAAGGQRQGHDQGKNQSKNLLFHLFSPFENIFLISFSSRPGKLIST